ncbi:DUF885 domain-containing protein [Roseateles asaccharophilus]|uniref:Uncharacterized protein (DUF885 family) n=1 Tax=Roseateles asaccharophilus TaxID=582607 RepID=A0ABU2AGN7_9BURK|nr:DUF885 domain-containing protein [Roseateles asaccharophilus]MDR7335803.1 uncharacterized protein (DUF885 family) [Roseateles asaccharophilus]
MRLQALTVALILGCFSFAETHAATPTERLADLATRYYDARAGFEPLGATENGDNRFDDQLAIDIAPAERAKRFAAWRGFLKELQALPAASLPPEQRLNRELLEQQLLDRLAFERFPDHLLPLHHMGATPLQLAFYGGGEAGQPLKTAAQLDAYLKRVARLPAWCDQAIANLREGMRRGVVQSGPVVDATLPLLRNLANDDADKSAFTAPVRAMPAGIAPDDAARLTVAYRQEWTERVAPALRRLVAFIEADYVKAVRRDAIGWGALPDGRAWYRQWVREATTTDMTPEQIHALGQQEVARIQREIAQLAPKLGFTGDPLKNGGLLAWARSDARFRPFKTEAEILDHYRALNARVAPQMPKLFGRQPRMALDIRPEPELTRATASDHYTVGQADGSAPGIFWAVINDPAAYSVTTMTALFLHEGQPGHHFHLGLQLEMPLPDFRRRTWINAYGEGWALYAETLGHELGLYADPVAYAGALRLEISRAARLVVDTGLHAKGWSRGRALQYWMDVTGASEQQAAAQIDRYLAWPGQALGYKIGSLKIQELRRRAEQKLGAKFSLAAFHDQVLGEGAMPLAVLEKRIDAWIAAQAR